MQTRSLLFPAWGPNRAGNELNAYIAYHTEQRLMCSSDFAEFTNWRSTTLKSKPCYDLHSVESTL